MFLKVFVSHAAGRLQIDKIEGTYSSAAYETLRGAMMHRIPTWHRFQSKRSNEALSRLQTCVLLVTAPSGLGWSDTVWRARTRGAILSPSPVRATARSFPTRAADKFMALLRDGDCPALLRLVAPHFRYTLTNFDMVGGPAVVFTPANLSRLCHNTARGFDYRVRRAQDLTATFGQMEVVGADYVSTGGPAPCLVPFLITVVVTLDEKGSIRSLKELMDAESYVRYAQACRSKPQMINPPTPMPVADFAKQVLLPPILDPKGWSRLEAVNIAGKRWVRKR